MIFKLKIFQLFFFIFPVPPIIDRDYLYKDKIWTRTWKTLKFENPHLRQIQMQEKTTYKGLYKTKFGVIK